MGQHDSTQALGATSYDPEADALYVRLSPGPVERTIEVHDGYAVDIDAAGEIVGVERLGVRADAERRIRPTM